MIVPRKSLVHAAYDSVRASVLDGSLAPGARVTVRPLAEKLGLSPTPIKAALAALEREGFLEAVPHRGYFVPRVGVEDVLELYELREAVDAIAARRSAASANHLLVAQQLRALLNQQQGLVAKTDVQGYAESDLQFHHLIWQASGNRRLLPIAGNLIAQVRLGNRMSALAPGRLHQALEEHAAIIEAIAAGDPRAANKHVRHHVRQAGRALERYLGLAAVESGATAQA